MVPEVHNHFVSDAVTQYLPYALFAHASYRSEGWVGWNPLIFGGVAQHANTMSLPYEGFQQLHRFLDFWPAWHLSKLGQFFLAGLGMLVFLRSRKCDPGPALLGAAAYMLNTQFVVWIYHDWALASFCWIPWLLWSLHLAVGVNLAFLIPSALFLVLSLLGGTLQHAAFVALVLFCLWAGWLWESKGQGVMGARRTLLLVAAGLAGAGLALPMLEPCIYAYLENLQAGHTRGGLGYSGGYGQPILNFLALPLTPMPTLMGSPTNLDLWKIFKSDVFNVAAFGALPVMLAFLGLFSRRVPASARLLMWVGLLIPLTPLVGPLYHRVQLLWIFGGCWAAAAWIQQTPPDQLRQLASRLWAWLAGFSGVWLLVSLVLFGLRTYLEPLAQEKIAPSLSAGQFGVFHAWASQRIHNFFDYMLIWNSAHLLVLAGVGLCLWGLPRILHPRGPCWMAAAAGVFLQALVFWGQWVSWSETKEDVYQRPAWVEVLQREVGPNGRLAQEAGGFAQVPFGPNTLQPSGVPVAGGYESIHPHGLRNPGKRAWEFPGTTHYLGNSDQEGPEGWRRLRSENGWSLWKNPQPDLGTIYFAGGTTKTIGEDALERPSWNRISVRLPAGSKSMDLFSNWNRGWEWSGDPGGAWAPTQPSRQGGMRLQFDAPLSQERKIALRYNPAPPVWTLWVRAFSALGLVAVVGVGIWAKPRPS